jgi:isopenicillin N synthase-like dioxygenase
VAATLKIPVIDIAPYVADGTPEERRLVAKAMDEANRTVGFVQIRGHEIPDTTIGGLAAAMDAFFAQSSEQKARYRAPAEVNRGYTPPRSESLSLSLGVSQTDNAYDCFEAFNIGEGTSAFPGLDLPEQHYPENLWPDIGHFRGPVEAYFAEAGRVARVLTTIFADALELEADYFAPFTDHSIDVLRMNHYALPERTEVTSSLRGMGEHTDFGIVTVLWADPLPGLQILDDDGVWHDVLPMPGALLINLGDLTARWTNDRWRSTMHRVMPPVLGGQTVRRRSAAYFHDGNVDAVVATLDNCRDADGNSEYAPTTVADHIAAKLAGSRGGRANYGAEREAARLRVVAPISEEV